MKMSFRWYGDNDPVSLQFIRQIPCMQNIVTAIYNVPVGEVWSREDIFRLKEQVEKQGLSFKVVESVPVHESIKLGTGDCVRYIENYCENIRRLGEAGVEVVCYNFMPVFDWFRTDLGRALVDGSFALAYDHEDVLALDPHTSDPSLPGWDESYSKAELKELLNQYKEVDEEKLWLNFERFISAVVPVCEESNVKMAIHPDDPPWDIFGLPRIIRGEESYARMVKINPSEANGITFCTGSLGADPMKKLDEIAVRYCDRIHFVHMRNVLITGEKSFEESPHPSACGSLDMFAILKALYDGGFDGYVRPDHGRMIWGETGKPGYGLYDRALGATYLLGLWEAIEKLDV